MRGNDATIGPRSSAGSKTCLSFSSSELSLASSKGFNHGAILLALFVLITQDVLLYTTTPRELVPGGRSSDAKGRVEGIMGTRKFGR